MDLSWAALLNSLLHALHGSSVTMHGKGGLDGHLGGLALPLELPRLGILSWPLSHSSLLGPETAYYLLVDVAAKFILWGHLHLLKSWGALRSWAVSF